MGSGGIFSNLNIKFPNLNQSRSTSNLVGKPACQVTKHSKLQTGQWDEAKNQPEIPQKKRVYVSTDRRWFPFGYVGDELVKRTTECIERLIDLNTKKALKKQEDFAKCPGVSPPASDDERHFQILCQIPNQPVTTFDLLRRVVKYTEMPASVFLCGVIFVDRLIVRTSQQRFKFQLTPQNCHQCILIAMMTAHKFFQDTVLDNFSWAWIGHVKLDTLNKTETSFLSLLDYGFLVEEREYLRYYRALVRAPPAKQDMWRLSTPFTPPKHTQSLAHLPTIRHEC